MIADFCVINNPAVKIKSLIQKSFCSVRVFAGFADKLYEFFHIRYKVVRNISAVCSRICDKLLFIKLLCYFKRFGGCKPDHIICIHLQCSQVVKFRTIFSLFFCFCGYDIHKLTGAVMKHFLRRRLIVKHLP